MYGNDALYKVQAVGTIKPLLKANADGHNGRSGQNEAQKTERKSFARVLDEKDIERQRDIRYQTSGYTRNAMAFFNIYQTREYSYPEK